MKIVKEENRNRNQRKKEEIRIDGDGMKKGKWDKKRKMEEERRG